MKYLLTFASALLLLMTACSKDDDKSDFTKNQASRAVMIYMSGENNLTSNSSGYRALQNDLSEIVEGSKTLAYNHRLFVFVDSLGTNEEQKGTPFIIEVHGGNVYERIKFDSDFSTADADKFREVVSWMTDNINADGYGLVLWGHATGWVVEKDSVPGPSRRAYGLDSGEDLGSKNERWMNITQMAQALDGLPKLDFIFADCCNMMCAEVGYELRNVTDYLIGSPAEIPGPGAPYDIMLFNLFKTGSNLYNSIIDTYYEYYLEAYKAEYTSLAGYSVPLSVIDTKYMEELATATRDILDKFTDGYPLAPDSPDLNGIAMYDGYDSPLMYDMRAFIKKHVSSDDFQTWEDIYRQAVPYYRMSMKWMTIYDGYNSYNLEAAMNTFDKDQSLYGCVSMFIPLNLTAYNGGEYAYNKIAAHFAWNRIMNWGNYGW